MKMVKLLIASVLMASSVISYATPTVIQGVHINAVRINVFSSEFITVADVETSDVSATCPGAAGGPLYLIYVPAIADTGGNTVNFERYKRAFAALNAAVVADKTVTLTVDAISSGFCYVRAVGLEQDHIH